MSPSTDRIADDDLTAKARIRNCALRLYAGQGEERTSMRAVAAAAGVTVGLVVHHYGSKDGVREAVERHIVEHFAEAITSVPDDVPPTEVVAARNAAVAEMLASTPDVVNYLRRAGLETSEHIEHRGHILDRLTDLTLREIEAMRAAGTASLERSAAEQTVDVMVTQLGQLFLQPLVDSIWDRVTSRTTPRGRSKPSLVVGIDREPHRD